MHTHIDDPTYILGMYHLSVAIKLFVIMRKVCGVLVAKIIRMEKNIDF